MTFARLRGLVREAAERAVEALESELALTEIASMRVDRCSSGMIQQLAFARALLADPALILLDEPTRSLDDEAVLRLWAALDRRPALAVLLASHREEDLIHCGSRVELPR